jgi:4-diphosphocytidyl-2-C-methyl-D-erythritol kinase
MDMTIRAYAKINIGLRILNKRDDGYHNIETIFHRINLFDEIRFQDSCNLLLECNNPEIPTDNRNLCMKAAQILQKNYKVTKGAKILLNKNIPIGAGLGGGSSDAAYVLKHLPNFLGIEIPKEELYQLAMDIGSDVPYFLDKSTAYATGRGEQLEYFRLDIPYWIIIVHPNVQISTAWAYANLKLKPHQQENNLKELLIDNIEHPEKLRELIHNDFEDLVLQNHPDIKRLKENLYKQGAEFVQMSGSGSSVYAFFKHESKAREAIRIFSKDYLTFLTEPNFNPSI